MRKDFNKHTVIRIVISFLLILVGGFAYCNLKSNTIINVLFDKYLLIEKHNHNSTILLFMYNWGIDFVWICSFYLMLSAFCKHKVSLVISLTISISYEISQLLIKTLGTFDVLDIVAYIIGAVSLYVFYKYFRKEV